MTTIFDTLRAIAVKYDPYIPDVAETYYCQVCRETVTAQPNDICTRCAENKARGYEAMMLAGRCSNGSELDHGTNIHAVDFRSRKARCGAQPGRRSVGWVYPNRRENTVTCPRCAKKVSA